MNPKLPWELARAGGLTAWWLLGLSTMWGLLLSTRLLAGRPRPAWLLDLHRFLGGLALTFTGVHIGGLVADHVVHFGLMEVAVPFSSAWRPVAVAWGTISLYLLLAIELTSLGMRHLPRRVWRAVHSTSFVLFVLTSLHAVTAGTDTGNSAVQWSGLAMGLVLVFLTVYRAALPARGPARISVAGRGSPRGAAGAQAGPLDVAVTGRRAS